MNYQFIPFPFNFYGVWYSPQAIVTIARPTFKEYMDRSKSPPVNEKWVPAKKFETLDKHIESFPENVQSVLEKLRATVQEVAPEAVESISYDMPTFRLNGERMVYFSAWKNHIGLYSIPRGDDAFRKELSQYEGGKARSGSPWKSQYPTI